MKNSQNAFCIRSPMTSRPYYVISNSDGTNKISWIKETGYHLCEPNDMDPFFPNYDDKNDGNHNDYLQIVSHISKNRIYQNVEPSFSPTSNEMPILQLTSSLNPSFLCTPYFPFDTLLHDSTDGVAFMLYQTMQSKDKKLKRATEDLQISIKKDRKSKRLTDDLQFAFQKDKKQKRSSDDLLNGNKFIVNPDSPVSATPGLSSLVKNIKKFILSDNLDDFQYPITIINLIKKEEELLSECIYQLILLTDTTKSTTSVIQSWKLMMLIVGYFSIPEPHSEYLKDFLISAAGHIEVDYEIQFRAKICLCRIFCENQLNFEWTGKEINYIKASTSMTQLFGVSLSEILVKEEYKRVRSPEYDSKILKKIKKNSTREKKIVSDQTKKIISDDMDNDTFIDSLNKMPESFILGHKSEYGEEKPVLVPIILKKFIKAMLSLNCLQNEGTFRTSGDSFIENQTVEDINNGYWEEPTILVTTIASTIKRFLRELQDPLIPNYIIEMSDQQPPPFKIIQEINQLPPQNKETLMYFVGFLQQIADNHKVNKMNSSNLAISLGNMFNSKIVSNDPMKYKQILDKMNFIVGVLINHWNTSPIYDL